MDKFTFPKDEIIKNIIDSSDNFSLPTIEIAYDGFMWNANWKNNPLISVSESKPEIAISKLNEKIAEFIANYKKTPEKKMKQLISIADEIVKRVEYTPDKHDGVDFKHCAICGSSTTFLYDPSKDSHNDECLIKKYKTLRKLLGQ